MVYEATRKSLDSHPMPEWFANARLGIFIHWGPYSVPGWAATPGDPAQIIAEKGWAYWFANNPYAEWYGNSLRIPGSPTAIHHRQTYGADFPYERFGALFSEAAAAWDPNDWADLFARAGARYVVIVTKHHDGFLLWPSRTPNPRIVGWHTQRDLVGELAQAVRDRGMRFGVYYSGGLDWTFNAEPIRDFLDLLGGLPYGREYAAYVDAHYRELIERYQPDVLWNDIGYPPGPALNRLLADYYNRFPQGVVNDRFSQLDLGAPGSLKRRLLLKVIGGLAVMMMKGDNPAAPSTSHSDFITPEYRTFQKAPPKKWESTRGLGASFGYNRNEGDQHLLGQAALQESLAQIVAQGGNLLLNVGPKADGEIPAGQRERLEGLGAWMRQQGWA